MGRTLATLERAVVSMEEALIDPKFPVEGFMFTLDTQEPSFDAFTQEAITDSGFWEEGQPQPEGFIYISESYHNYVEQLILNDEEHISNTNKLSWAPISTMKKQHWSTPSLESIEAQILAPQLPI